MSMNILNDISKVYLENVAESAVPGKPAERLGAVTAIPKSEQDAARERLLAKAKAKREKVKEALDPVGREDKDIDNDGDSDKSDKYLLNRRKVRGAAISKKKMKESFSNWRQDLSEVMDDVEAQKEVKEKKVNNKITINPDFKESVENMGGTILEMVEVDEVDYIVESVYDELIEEGYDEDDIEEALEFALTEAKVTYGHDTSSREKKRGNLVKAVGRLARQKLASKVRGAKSAVSSAVSKGARKVAKGALGVARKMEGGDKKPSTAHTKTRTASTYRGAGAGTKEKVSSGSYQAPSANKKKAEKPADPWKGSSTVPQKPKAKAKAKVEKPADPWEGSATTPAKPKAPAAAPKAATKKAAAPKAKTAASKGKKKSKLDDLLASVRSEQVQIDEKTLTKREMSKREELVKSMKSKASDFEKRYPGRGKEVMYATATKMAKKMAEQMETTPIVTSGSDLDKKKEMLDKQKLSNMKMLQQKQRQLQNQKMQMKKSGKLPLEAD